jgi:hypothetical protein
MNEKFDNYDHLENEKIRETSIGKKILRQIKPLG